jgi:CO/xanthine dehydrogenase Mo-binding subunit
VGPPDRASSIPGCTSPPVSATIQDAGNNLRQAAAEARKALLDLASKQLNVAAGNLSVRDGVVSRADGSGKVSYAQLIGDNNFNVELKALTTPNGMLIPFAGPALSGTTTLRPNNVQAAFAAVA